MSQPGQSDQPGLDRRDADPALADAPAVAPAPPPGKRALTAMLPPKGDPDQGHALIYRPEVPKPKRGPAGASAGPEAAPAEDPFALHITLAQPPARPAGPAKREPSPEAVKAIAQEEAPPPAPPPEVETGARD